MKEKCDPKDRYSTRMSIYALGNIAVGGGIDKKDIEEIDFKDYPSIEEAMYYYPDFYRFFNEDKEEFIEEPEELLDILIGEEFGYCDLEHNFEYGNDAKIECDEGFYDEKIQKEIKEYKNKKSEEVIELIHAFASKGWNYRIQTDSSYYIFDDEFFLDNMEEWGLIEDKWEDPFTIKKEICKHKPSGIWYHGTTSKNLEKIMQEGLRAGKSIFCNPNLPKRLCSSAVYLTQDPDIAYWYALEVSSTQGGKPIIVKVKIDDTDKYREIYPDEDMFSGIDKGLFTNLDACCD